MMRRRKGVRLVQRRRRDIDHFRLAIAAVSERCSALPAERTLHRRRGRKFVGFAVHEAKAREWEGDPADDRRARHATAGAAMAKHARAWRDFRPITDLSAEATA